MKDRKELKSSEDTRITLVDGTARLEISQASKADAGDYLCKANNATGSEFCKSRVTVKGKPIESRVEFWQFFDQMFRRTVHFIFGSAF